MNNLTKSLLNAAPVLLILLFCLAIFFFVTQMDHDPHGGRDVMIASQNGREVRMRDVLPLDGILSIDTPRFVKGEHSNYAPNERIIGVVYDNQARAYSVPYLSKSLIVNDDFRGLQLAITWCPLCYTANVFERNFDDIQHSFGNSGHLIMNTNVMYDRETGTYWSQFIGEAVEGQLVPMRLTPYPNFWFTTWGEWLKHYPDSIALEKLDPGRGSTDSYADYYENDERGIHRETIADARLPGKALLIGMELNGEAVAYPYETLTQQIYVHDVLGDLQTLIIFWPESETGIVFDRTVNGRELNFALADGIMTDVETGSTWDAWTGVALDGDMQGQQLQRIPSISAFWFVWKDWYPETRIYGQG